MPEKVYESLRVVFRKAFEIIFEKGTGMIEKTYRKEELSKDFRMRDFSIGLNSRKEYFWLNARSDLNSLATLCVVTQIKTVENDGYDAVQRVLVAPVNKFYFHYDTPEEKYFILTILEGSLLKGEAWDACSERVNALLVSPHIPTEREMKEQLQYTADAFAIDMMVSKFIQGIPVLGVVGGLANPVYYRKLQQYVRLKYQKRFLMAKSA